MHPKEALNNPSILSDIFTEMEKGQRQPMSKDETVVSINLNLMSPTQCGEVYDKMAQMFPMNAFFNRCNAMPIRFDLKALMWLAVLTFTYGIGGMILVGYYVQWWATKNEIKLETEGGKVCITLDDLMENVFPTGMFTEESISKFWDEQKVQAQPDNLVDHASAAWSFIPPEAKA